MEGLLLPRPPGKDYRLLKVVTQAATPEQAAWLGNDRVPMVRRLKSSRGNDRPVVAGGHSRNVAGLRFRGAT